MRKILLFFSSVYFIVFFSIQCIASDENPKKITTALTHDGFENVIVSIDSLNIIASYENRIYRNESEAAAIVINILRTFFKSNKNLILIPQFRKIPMLCIIISDFTSKSISSEQIEVSMDTQFYSERIKNISYSNSSKYKTDIIISPQLKARFGNYDKIAETQINIAPEIRSSLWKGMSFSGQVILPLYNELDSIGNYIRPGLVTVNQLVRLPFNTFASGTLGYFTENRLGVDLEIKKFSFNGRVSASANIGYTGYAFFDNGTWYYSDEKKITYMTSVSYRNPQFDLNFKVSYGKFLNDNNGWRFDVSRQFGETEIGFFGIRTNFGNNAGFNFSVPIFPSKYWKIKSVRVRPAESFPWEYRYKFLTDARTYNTGNRIENMTGKFNPDFFKKELMNTLKRYLQI